MTFFKKKAVQVKKPWYREWAEALIFALVLALLIRTFVFQAFKIPSGSMLDTLQIGDHLLVNKFIYGTELPFSNERFWVVRPPERGDVIVFEFPKDADKPYFERRDFIKRVIGVPGDTVEIRGKTVFVNGKPYVIPQEVHKDPQMSQPTNICVFPFGNKVMCRDFMPAVKVPDDSYFVMGDNRDESYDSRFWGFVPRENIKGLAFIKYWSWNSNADILHKVRWDRIGRLIE